MLGVTTQSLQNWEKDAWWDRQFRTSAGFDVAAIRAARDKMGRKGSPQSEESIKIKRATDAEKLKHAVLKTQTDKLALMEREKKLLPRRLWELRAAGMLTNLSDWCEQLPDLIAADCPRRHRAKLKRKLKEELDRRRRELRDKLERNAVELDQSQAEK